MKKSNKFSPEVRERAGKPRSRLTWPSGPFP
jgi:hypothetical protein